MVVKKTIEETYQKLSQKEHILLKSGMYVGDTSKHNEDIWVVSDNKIVKQNVNYCPAFMKIFDEILTNSLDHSERDKTLTSIKVNYNSETGEISVWNNGEGIPVMLHQEHQIYVPELIFGHLLSGSNFNENEQRTGAGTHGLGGKLTNLFSKKFIVETVDASNKMKFYQEYENNMSKQSKAKVTKASVKGYTKITFIPDYSRFKMKGLEKDTIKLIEKRVYDCIATTRSKVKIYLNDIELKGKGLVDYIKYFSDETIISESFTKDNFIWEYAVIPSESYQQISFVNGNATTGGGKHVDYITYQITSKLKTLIETKKKIKDIKPNFIKDRMFLFLRATVINPQFNSQTKEIFTTPSKDFGVKVEVSDNFINKIYKSNITSEIVEFCKIKETSSLAKNTDGKKSNKLYNIPNLEDARWAGSSKSNSCSLILTEGLSAMTFAMWGRSIVGSEKYGIYPLKGVGLNVRDASVSQLAKNEEINNIKKIVGLKHEEQYTNTNSLRYSKIIILTDSDLDGIRIRGLLVNFIHNFWPSLIKLNPSFIQTIKTPIVKAIKGKTIKEFFTEQDYLKWIEKTDDTKSYQIRYFKGLGTSTKDDAKDTFKRLEELKVDYYYKNEKCDESILLAFDKDKNNKKGEQKCSDKRKQWLSKYDKNSYVSVNDNRISFTDLINKELIHFSIYDNLRSIPSICDGLKPSQRKILHYMLNKNSKNSVKVAQLSGYIGAETGYHHGETSLQQAIIGMAQNFIGTNNINLLYPDGNFGSRNHGGSDAASPRYIFTKLEQITNVIFNKYDIPLLEYLNDDGVVVEPEWFIPIIPMILVNGCSGIGTGYSSSIPSYNPLDIISNIMRLLDNKEPEPLSPYFKHFKGKVEEISEGNYQTKGVWKKMSKTKIQITELPVGKWVSSYKEYLESLVGISLKDVQNLTRDENNDIQFEVEFNQEISLENVEKDLKLVKKFSTTNMYLFNKDRILKKYDNPNDILKEYFSTRLLFYQKRKDYIINKIQEELKVIRTKALFIKEYIEGILDINKKTQDYITDLLDKRFYHKVENSYNYLTSMPMSSLSSDKINSLNKTIKNKEEELEFYLKTSTKTMWKIDLKELVKLI